jgi:uncharacterized protein YgiM (DUF1202 family)
LSKNHFYRIKDKGRLTISILFLVLVVLIPTTVYFVLIRDKTNKEPTKTFVQAAQFTPTPEVLPTETPAQIQVVRIKLSDPTSTLRVRKQPNANAPILGNVKHDAVMPYVGLTGDWWIINYNGQNGYIVSTYGVLETVEPESSQMP